jgi:hypothetical protein
MAAVALALLGVLLFLEVIRPFHNLSIDGPLALLFWGIGAALSLATLWLSGRSFILSAASLSVNVMLLLAALLFLWLVGHSNFAWH